MLSPSSASAQCACELEPSGALVPIETRVNARLGNDQWRLIGLRRSTKGVSIDRDLIQCGAHLRDGLGDLSRIFERAHDSAEAEPAGALSRDVHRSDAGSCNSSAFTCG